MRRRAPGLVGLAALLLGGCMVGPDYSKPSVPMTPAYKETEGWKVATPSDHLPRGQWSKLFADSELDSLAEEVSYLQVITAQTTALQNQRTTSTSCAGEWTPACSW